MQERQQKLADKINKTTISEGEVGFWWIGQSGFVVKSRDTTFVFDPYLSTTLEEATRDQAWKRHVRMMDIPVAGEMLKNIDYLVISHGHRDHYDEATVAAIERTNPDMTILAPRPLVSQLEASHRCRVVGLENAQKWSEDFFSITAVKAKHNEYDKTEEGFYPYLSYAIEVGGARLFFAGDTILHPPLTRSLSSCKPALAFLPINGYTDELLAKGFASNLTYKEAIVLALEAEVGYMIPCHWGMFTINTEQVGKFVNEANAQNLRYIVPTILETFIMDAKGEVRWK